MFSNPIGGMFGKGDGEEKKKKRNKKSKKFSPEISVETNSLNNSKNDLTSDAASAEPVPVAEVASSNLLDIVAEINSQPKEEVVEVAPEAASEPAQVEQAPEQSEEVVETKYEELPVEESTMKTIIDSIQNSNPEVQESAWDQFLEPAKNPEDAWESEVAAAPQAIDSVWNDLVSGIPSDQLESVKKSEPVNYVSSAWEDLYSAPGENNPYELRDQRERIVEEFGISLNSYELIEDFFYEQNESDLLSNDLLRYLLNNARAQRDELKEASEEDVDRALSAIDSDHDNKLNFDEFVHLLSLFFSSSNNLKQRISGVLKNLSTTHEKRGYLTNKEAKAFTDFLNQFFGKKLEESEEKTINFLSKLVKKILKRNSKKSGPESEETTEYIDYLTFSTEASEELQNLCFVKFN